MHTILVSKPIFSKQAKLLRRLLPGPALKLSKTRELLSVLYGFGSHHEYLKCLKESPRTLGEQTRSVFTQNYTHLISRLALIAAIPGHEAKFIINNLWPNYLTKELVKRRQHRAGFVLHGDLHGLVTAKQTKALVEYSFDGEPALKDSIESIGIPHTEVVRILCSQESISQSATTQPGRIYHLYPPGLSVGGEVLMAPKPQDIRFILDVHLGKLARYLRLLGFDTIYSQKDLTDAVLADLSHKSNRILLTRDKGLLKRSIVRFGFMLRSKNPLEQLQEVLVRYQLACCLTPFSRCLNCNSRLVSVQKNAIQNRVPLSVVERYETFKCCTACDNIYWKGSHYKNMEQVVAGFFSAQQ